MQLLVFDLHGGETNMVFCYSHYIRVGEED